MKKLFVTMFGIAALGAGAAECEIVDGYTWSYDVRNDEAEIGRLEDCFRADFRQDGIGIAVDFRQGVLV